MSEHYYTQRPSAAHDQAVVTATLRGIELHFITDTAVFSRDRVDYGSTLLIEVMQIDPNDRVLDLGCGYGPVGITAARLAKNGYVYLVDVNERAAELARQNLVHNQISNAEIRTGDGLAPVQGLAFDKILMNPPIRAGKAVIYRMIDESFAALVPSGSLWVVIQVKQGAPSMKKKLTELCGYVEDVGRSAGYHVFRADKNG